MKLGLVGWPSETGLGMEIRDAVRYLPVSGVFYMNHPGKPMAEEFKNETVGDRDIIGKMESFLSANKIDTVLTWETPGNWKFPKLWERKGVRWFCVVHWDWFAPKQMESWKRARLIAPFEATSFGLRLVYGLESVVVPVPVDLSRLEYRKRRQADRFVTVYGMGGPKDRRSICQIVEAWRMLGSEAPRLTILAQKAPIEIEGIPLPKTVDLKIGVLGNACELYRGFDVAVLPSKYEGVGLSLMEAQASGLPVITTDMEPMRSIAPWYVIPGIPGEVEIMEGHRVAIQTPMAASIAQRVMAIAYQDIEKASENARLHIEKNYSWSSLKDKWVSTLAGSQVERKIGSI